MKEKTWLNDAIFYVFILIGIAILVFTQGGNSNKSNHSKIVGIHIKGDVVAPGYYELSYGSRVKDAILIAGGETETADLEEVNMARKLSDGEELYIPSVQNPDEVSDTGIININTADLYNLCKLEGIGEATATDIINYRVENGPFKSIQDLKKVKGIGDAKFENIKDNITV